MVNKTGSLVSSGGLDAELDADGRQVDVGSMPVKSIGATLIVGVTGRGTKVNVNWALACLEGADVGAI